jgi:hypothetical protein
VAQDLPDELQLELIESSLAQHKSLGAGLLTPVARRLSRPDSDELRAGVGRLAAHYPELATVFLRTCLTDGSVQLSVVQLLFHGLLQDRSGAQEVARVLDALSSERSTLGKETALSQEDPLILCLDNWAMLRADMKVWPLLKASYIEGSLLVEIANKWLSYTNKPHRLDMLVIILEDVRRRSKPTWLTPASLKFQALCAAGRFSEAEGILRRHPDISIKGRSARDYLRKARARTPEREGTCASEFERLWELVNLAGE